MTNKNKIYIAIISVAVIAAGFFLYKTFSGSSSPASPDAVLSTTSELNILPLGNKFDISTLKKLGSQFNVYNYPQVSLDSIGISTSNLIKSPAEAKPDSGL